MAPSRTGTTTLIAGSGVVVDRLGEDRAVEVALQRAEEALAGVLAAQHAAHHLRRQTRALLSGTGRHPQPARRRRHAEAGDLDDAPQRGQVELPPPGPPDTVERGHRTA